MSRVIDFTRNSWGHALHGQTYAEKVADKWKDRLVDRLRKRRRRTVMVHVSAVSVGDSIKYESARGTLFADVVGVKWCGDPKDMATLEIIMRDAPSGETP